MNLSLNRRHFLAASSAAVSTFAISSGFTKADDVSGKQKAKISLAGWSIHQAVLKEKTLTNLDFAQVARKEFDIDAIEFVNQFFLDKATDMDYLADLNKRSSDNGVKNLLIMIDREGDLGEPDDDKRTKTVENHKKWVDAAKYLGCHSIRVNAGSKGSFEEQQKLAADGLSRLSEYAAKSDLNVIVENHGGLSSDGSWLAGVMKMVNMKNCGTLPDFGNFYIRRGDDPLLYDRYKGVDELMPFAKAVSAKTYDFDEAGNETSIDYKKMMDIVLSHGYDGYMGIEYEGTRLSEFEGIRATKKLLEKCLVKV